MRLSSKNCKKPYVHRSWSSWAALTILISAGRTAQQGSSNVGDLSTLMTNSWHKVIEEPTRKVALLIVILMNKGEAALACPCNGGVQDPKKKEQSKK